MRGINLIDIGMEIIHLCEVSSVWNICTLSVEAAKPPYSIDDLIDPTCEKVRIDS